MTIRQFGSLVLLASVLLLGACGATQQGTTTAPGAAPTAVGGMAGMDHGTMPMGTAVPEATAADAMAGMDHGAMANSDAPYDAQFIDSMIVHHGEAGTSGS
jgi:uncharacterized protein (DUF305 family)